MLWFAHTEETTDWRKPRHPLVAIGDLLGAFGIMLVGIFAEANTANILYFSALIFLLLVSSVHHWWRKSVLLRKLDHAAIFVAITCTALPYWLNISIFSPIELCSALELLIITNLVGAMLKFKTFLPSGTNFWVYFFSGWPVMTLLGSETFWLHQGSHNGLIFMVGIGLYGLNGVVYARKWCDFWPDCFGYREVQHLALYMAMSCHIYVLL